MNLLRGEWRAAFAGIAVAALLAAATAAPAQAQAPAPGTAAPAPPPTQTTVERNAKGVAGRPIQVGIHLNVQPNCSSGPLPSIRMVTAPGNGTVTIKRGKVSATNYKQCLALEVPGFIAFYQSKADFAGTDTVTLEVKFPQGRTEVQRIMINVGVGPAGQKI
ncbi:hypothetical protein ACRAVF_23290 [Bradyrhizobium oligotrophicum S58]